MDTMDSTVDVQGGTIAVSPERTRIDELQTLATIEREKAARRLDLIRIAKEILTENRRMKGMDADDVTVGDVVAFAKELADYVG